MKHTALPPLSLLCWAARIAAQEPSGSLGDLTLEQLMNESVTSVSKRLTRLGDAPTAISVITQEEIRRSGYTSIPELLRLVPGLQVARIDGTDWAISSRGFNGQFANKLLVLIDGRTVYTPTSGGVYWNEQDTMIEDIERIEVIRGPGATLWGSNAVNGVINIITRSARDTRGTVASLIGGRDDRPTVSIRHGGDLDSALQYRAYLKYSNLAALETPDGHSSSDRQQTVRTGGRLDWYLSDADSGTLLADYYDNDTRKVVRQSLFDPPYSFIEKRSEHNSGGDLLGRWSHTLPGGSQLTIQAYLNHFIQDFGYGVEHHDSYDLDVQHHLTIGSRNDVVWGFGYRYTSTEQTQGTTLVWIPNRENLQLYHAFLQDEITLVPDHWRLILGTKFEHNDLTGLEAEPTARVAWNANPSNTVWAAVSDSTRTPSLYEHNGFNTVAIIPSSTGPDTRVQLQGNSDEDEEQLRAFELGYRFTPSAAFSLDVTGFYNEYRDLLAYINNPVAFVELPPPAHVLVSSTYQNVGRAQTYGAEIEAQWTPTAGWRLVTSYSGLRMHVRPDAAQDTGSPQHQAQLRTYVTLPRQIELNGALMYVDRLTVTPSVSPVNVPAYVRLDLGASWRPVGTLELGVWGQNLLQPRHFEFPSVQNAQETDIPRNFLARATWRF